LNDDESPRALSPQHPQADYQIQVFQNGFDANFVLFIMTFFYGVKLKMIVFVDNDLRSFLLLVLRVIQVFLSFLPFAKVRSSIDMSFVSNIIVKTLPFSARNCALVVSI
jgi:hypothetical protein